MSRTSFESGVVSSVQRRPLERRQDREQVLASASARRPRLPASNSISPTLLFFIVRKVRGIQRPARNVQAALT